MKIIYNFPPKDFKEPAASTEIINLEAPKVLPKKIRLSLTQLIMPLVRAIAVGGMLLSSLWAGTKNFSPYILAPFFMMAASLMHASGNHGTGEQIGELENWFKALRAERKKAHIIGKELYDDLIDRHPNPLLLRKIVGTPGMWGANLVKPGGVSSWKAGQVKEEIVIARMGLGLTAFPASRFQPSKSQIEENLEPTTAAAFRQFNRVQPFLLNAPFEFQWKGISEFSGEREKVLGCIRAIICQAATFYPPFQISFIIITDDENEWKWVNRLPHEKLLVNHAQDIQREFSPKTYHLTVVDNSGSFLPRINRGGIIAIRAIITDGTPIIHIPVS